MHRHIQNFGQSCPCLQCVNICYVFVGDISFGIKTEADSYAMPECPHDDMPSTGMIVLHYECILCTTFALMFMSFYYMTCVVRFEKKYIAMSVYPFVHL